jgi:SOS-response transcriptional repressor LexA
MIGELPRRQRDVLRFLEEYYLEHGTPPSVREIADDLGIVSTNGVADHLKALVHKGWLVSGQKGQPRSLVPVRVLRALDESAEPLRRTA